MNKVSKNARNLKPAVFSVGKHEIIFKTDRVYELIISFKTQNII